MATGPTLLLDSASLYYRAYYALPSSMTAPDGRPHGAVRGFLSTLGSLIERTEAQSIACCWDADWRPSWRVELLPTYKAHRVADEAAEGATGAAGAELEPDDLAPQIDAIAAILDASGIARIGSPHHEADDVIASYAMQLPGPMIAVTGDRDLLQIASDRSKVLLAVNGGMDAWPLLDPAAVRARVGVEPHQYVDMAVLRGDPSDGIPGAPGIGAKTAPALIAAFGSLEGVLSAARSGRFERPLTARLAASLLEHEEALRAARTVSTAVTTLELPSPSQLPASPPNPAALDALAAEWGVARFLPPLNRRS